MNIIRFFLFFVILQPTFALERVDVAMLEELVASYGVEDGLNSKQKFNAYSVLAFELDSYGFSDKSEEYYLKALKNIPKEQDSLEVYTNLLSVIFKQNKDRAKVFFKTVFRERALLSNKKEKILIIKFWEEVFSDKINTINHSGLYGEFFKIRDIKKLIFEKKYKTALHLLNPLGLSKSDINKKLLYDSLSKINGKKKGFLCEEKLKKYNNSLAVTMEICRYLVNGKSKYSSIQNLQSRIRDEMPHLGHIGKILGELALRE